VSDTITVTGLVATAPKLIVTGEGLAITNFRFASAQRRYDRGQSKWVDGETNWYTVTAFRQLATNVAGSLQKGQRIVVTGRLRVRDWTHDDKKGTNVEIDAEAIGHDLSWGTAAFTRSASAAVADDESATDAEVTSTEAADAEGADTESDESADTFPAPDQEAVSVGTPF
jgi:single-strand DNA-binding protein